MMPTSGNVKMALEALRSVRWRSLLTMLGIIIGVVSVVTVVSLGEGAKRGIVGQINQSGHDLVTVRPGRTIKREGVNVAEVSLFGAPSTGSLSETDLKAVRQSKDIKQVVPFSYVSSTAVKDKVEYNDGLVVGTTPDLPQALNLKVEYGVFFSDQDANKNGAVIGRRVAEQLFKENVPVGKLFTIRGKVFVVRGVFEEFDNSPLAPNANYNSTIFIPYEVGQAISGDSHIYQILARAKDPHRVGQAVANVNANLSKAHHGQHDYSVLTQEENLAVANEVVNLLTAFVTGVAAISLVVAGIGIMNIMLVSVTERTHEIGIRKAIGATNRQILGQFLIEAVILSLIGGVLGIIFALLTNFLLRIFTSLTPIVTWPIIVIAVGVAVIVGVIFGVTPALQAARKRPIESLRHQ
jgi:putative ABC transport system permease protein